ISVDCPSLVEKSTTVIDKLRPSLLADIWRHLGGVKPSECFGPGPGCVTVIFHDGRTFLLRVGPDPLPFPRFGTLFKLFRMFKSGIGKGVLNNLNILNSARHLVAGALQLGKSSAPTVHGRVSARRGDTSQSPRGRPRPSTGGRRIQPP